MVMDVDDDDDDVVVEVSSSCVVLAVFVVLFLPNLKILIVSFLLKENMVGVVEEV